MKFQRPNTPPSEMTTEQLREVIGGIRELAVDVVEYLSEVLAVLAERRERHEFMQDRILRFWRQINDKTLAAEAAIYLANKHTIKAVLPLPREEQIRIANGSPVPIAVVEPGGQIKSDDMPINRMDQATLKRVFGPNGIRTVYEQAEIILAASKVQKVGPLQWVEDRSEWKHGNSHLTNEDLVRALRSRGWECRWVGVAGKVA